MSGPPHWLAYACIASLWVAAGCVGMAGVAAVVGWLWPQQARDGPERGLSRPNSPRGTGARQERENGAQSLRLALRPQPAPENHTNTTVKGP